MRVGVGSCLLLVEDDPSDEHLALRAVRMSGVGASVRVAHDGREALELLRSSEATDFGAAFLDLKLPIVSGLSVLREIRSLPQTRYLPVVVLTSSDEPSDVREAYEAGANAFVRKPIDFDEYIQRISEAVRFWTRANLRPVDRNSPEY